jgi:hypothetical protein
LICIKMTFTDKPLPFSIDDILKYEKSKSSIYPSLIPRSYPLLSTSYLSYSTSNKHSCSGKLDLKRKKIKLDFLRTSINIM